MDADRIGLWGSSYAGGHAIVLGATDRRLRAVVAQVPTISGYQQSLRRVAPDQVPALEAAFADDERHQFHGAPPATQAVVSADPSVPAAYRAPDAVAFYNQPVPEGVWDNVVTLRSTRAARMYEPGTWIARVSPTPLLMVVGLHDTITLTDLALGAYEAALQPKKLVTIDGGHFDPYLTRFADASGAAVAWFTEHLNDNPKTTDPKRNTPCLNCTTRYSSTTACDATASRRLPDGSPIVSSPVASTLIYGDHDAVLVDPPFTHEQISRVGDWIERSGKHLTAVYATHGHGDHWFGTDLLLQRFPGAVAYATEGTIAMMHQQATEGRAQMWDVDFPGLIPPSPVVYQPIPADGIKLEGHRLLAVEVGHTDTDDTTVLHVPSIGLVVAGDVAYNGVHQYLLESAHGGVEAWLAALDKVAALQPRAVVAGHKNKELPDDPAIIDQTRDYLLNASRLLDRKAQSPCVFRRDDRAVPGPAQRGPGLVHRRGTGVGTRGGDVGCVTRCRTGSSTTTWPPGSVSAPER